jgi:hypothetical protein
MTSQLILANGHGIALASDSAVTMGHRTFETSEKIYPLGLPHRLAVLHSGNVMFHGLPHGTLVNEWIRSLGDVQLRSVSLYRENFLSWITDNLHHWTNESELTIDLVRAFRFDFERIWEILKTLDDPQNVDQVKSVWTSELKDINEDDASSTEGRKRAIRTFDRLWNLETSKSLREVYSYWFDDVATSSDIDEIAKEYMIASIENRYPFSTESYSQLVFVGYGSTDMVARSSDLFLYGAIDGIIKYGDGFTSVAQREGAGVWLIKPSGQYDAIDLVFRGFDSRFIQATKSAAKKAVENTATSPSSEDPLENYMNKIDVAIEDTFYNFSEETRLSGLRRAVMGMPLATLARISKSLIDVQRLSLEIAGKLQSVGGQVDVGVITLKDGFRWVRQKDFGDEVE